ncbi:DnaB-like helicase N-terminal domain-containing protein [Kitasatospora sp. NPDC059827]|uniref:DnaB-like helicase N-terminal domain-containing protein n=1 Tax=Kitasatospora sp. NPDC059827 TaxID=3346964 RepID=UPI0036648A90
MPYDLAAEQIVLSAMPRSKDFIADVVETIRPADYYRPAHVRIHGAVLALYAGGPADPTSPTAGRRPALTWRASLLRLRSSVAGCRTAPRRTRKAVLSCTARELSPTPAGRAICITVHVCQTFGPDTAGRRPDRRSEALTGEGAAVIRCSCFSSCWWYFWSWPDRFG